MSDSGTSGGTNLTLQTKASVFSISGGTSDDAQDEVAALMAQGMSADAVMETLLGRLGPPGSQQGTGLNSPPGLTNVSMAVGNAGNIDVQMEIDGSQQVATPLATEKARIPEKQLTSSSPRGRARSTRVTSRPPPSPNFADRLRSSERAKEKTDKENLELLRQLKEAKEIARTNESAWEHSQAQKRYEVDRLQKLVAHASEQNKQLRYNEQTQKQEAMKWAEQSMMFKNEAERLENLRALSEQEKNTIVIQAKDVFEKARLERSKYDNDTLQLREHLDKVMAAGRAIEGVHERQRSELAEYANSAIGCEDCI